MNSFYRLLPVLMGSCSSHLNAMGEQELCASSHTDICDSLSLECKSTLRCYELRSSISCFKGRVTIPLLQDSILDQHPAINGYYARCGVIYFHMKHLSDFGAPDFFVNGEIL